MAQPGSIPPRERPAAAPRRDAERDPQAAEAGQPPAQSGQRSADERTSAVERQIKALDEMLTSVLPLAPLSFDGLMIAGPAPRFDPGPLGLARPAPSWDDYAPVRPRGLRRLFGGAARYNRQLASARTRFEAAQAGHHREESQRRKDLAAAKARHDRQVTAERARAARHNADVAARRAAFAAGEAEAVAWFVGRVLDASRYPSVFPREHRVAYRPDSRDVVVEFELPPPRIVPAARAFRYTRTRDVIEPLPRPDSEIRLRYRRLIACVALRTLHEIFTATPPEVVAAVVFNGRVAAVDPATGQPARPCLLSASVPRSAFDPLILAAVDPDACLAHLGALISADPVNLEPVDPLPTPGLTPCPRTEIR